MLPKHVAVIMDGNRRFSKRLMLKPWKGHEWGADKLEQLLGWCQDLSIAELTVYAFSIQNFNRPKEEFDFIMNVFLETARRIEKRIAAAELPAVRILFIGRISLFPPLVQEAMHSLMEATKNNNRFQLNIAMAYGGREEVIDAVKKLGEQLAAGTLCVADINEDVFGKNLYMNHEPDLIIRTGGEHRTSNFLIWQSHYSEWFFVEKLWPEFTKEDFLQIITEYGSRERRFGK